MINVAIIGASGYTGLELIKILAQHPKFNISYIGASKDEIDIVALHPSLKDVYQKEVSKTDVEQIARVASLAILALPHKTSMEYAKELLRLGLKVVDLSADYRLKLEEYEKFYCEHADEKNLSHAIYGLPEMNKKHIKKATLVANPGCYPTASLLALLPFVKYLDKKRPIFIDAKSGVSGAGKKLSDTTHFVKVNENIFSYSPMGHRHEPEIIEKLEKLSHKKFDVHFVPHLVPVTRGMLVSIYCTLKKEIDAVGVLKSYYKNKKFIRVCESPVSIKNTAGTNFCDIFVKQKQKTLFINSSIDNLLRGASSQAVVNANLMYGFKESLGIPIISHVP